MAGKARYNVKSTVSTLLVDTITPVSIYQTLRDRFPNCLLLESTDYRGVENSYSFICAKPLASFKVEHNTLKQFFPDRSELTKEIKQRKEVEEGLESFMQSFKLEHESGTASIANGLFGYIAYDSVQFYEDIDFKQEADGARAIPDVSYAMYEYVLAINHYRNEMHIIHNCYDDKTNTKELDFFKQLCHSIRSNTYPFALTGSEESNFSDEEFKQVIEDCKKHVFRGDVFQIVPSRRYFQSFKGDDFNVYRALRSINPSPYLFYFDYGAFRIFGSSPEAQLVIKDGQAVLYPIAGTYRRTGDDSADTKKAEALRDDPKENAEHVMLVDLARNDLSKHCRGVKVESFKEIQYYSHVIHLVSKVTGNLLDNLSTISVLADTFPAGTLSGAPKYRAMELLDKYEKGKRYFYGGAIGFLDFNGNCNHAIMIRSFLSKNNVLYYQAGAGVVADSVAESEVQEVKNKLLALKSAVAAAEKL